MNAYVVVKKIKGNGLETSINMMVCPSEQLAKGYIKLLKAGRDRDNKGCTFEIEPWMMEATLAERQLGKPIASIEDLVDSPRYVLMVTNRDDLDIDEAYYLTKKDAEDAMWKSIKSVTGKTKKEFMEAADEDKCGYGNNGAWSNIDEPTTVWKISEIPTGSEFREILKQRESSNKGVKK